MESVIINDQGLYYEGEPTVTFSAPSTGGEYKRNESIQQVTDNYTIKGEVVKWSDSDNILGLIHVGASDGLYHEFTTTLQISSLTSAATVTAVTEDNQISANEQNDDFNTIGDSFLDFTESNPFGDPSE